MKQWKKTVVLAASLLTLVLPVGAEGLKTIGGEMQLPPGVSAFKFSDSLTGKYMRSTLEREAKELAVRRSSASGDREATRRRAEQENTEAFYKAIGVKGDYYQLKGQDQTGYKTASIVAVDLSGAAVAARSNLASKYGGQIPAATGYELDPLTEQVLLAGVNQNLGQLEGAINNSIAAKLSQDKDNQMNITVRLEDMEPLAPVTGSRYQSYMMSSRALVTINGFQQPYFVQSALVLEKEKPVLYVLLTADVERGYFKPIMEQMIKTLQ